MKLIVRMIFINFNKKILIDSFYYCLKNKDIDVDNYIQLCKAKNIYNSKLKIDYRQFSVTKIEKYNKCPFRFFADNVLRLKEKEKLELDSKIVGNILHKAMELLFDDTKNCLSDLSEEEFEAKIFYYFNNVVNADVYKCYEEKEFIPIMNLIREDFLYFAKKIAKDIKKNGFDIGKLEYAFSDILNVKGENYKISGVVDRIDESKDCFRLIDYKSGKAKYSNDDFYYGIRLQLLYYSKVIEKILRKDVSGSFYISLKDKTKSLMHGYIIDNDKYIKIADHSLFVDHHKCEFIPLKSTIKKDELIINKTNAITQNDFNKLQEYSEKLIKNSIANINDGYFSCSPIKDNQIEECNYCKFRNFCRFDKYKGNKFRELVKKNKAKEESDE